MSAPPKERLALYEGTRRLSWRSIPLILIADEVQRLRRNALQFAPAHQRLLAAVRHPDLAGARLDDGFQKLVPVGMVGDDERQLDAALFRALADAHPARSEAGD